LVNHSRFRIAIKLFRKEKRGGIFLIVEKIERPSKDLIKEIAKFPTALLSDAMEKSQAMQSEIKPVVPIDKVVGPAVTARTMVADYLTPVAAIDYAEPGDILVIDVRAHKDTAIWGGLASTSSKSRGIVAVIIDGAIRDVDEIRKIQFPVFARAVTPNAGDCSVLGDINVPIQCGGILVNPGDIVVADSDGVVVVPANRATQVLEKVRKQHDLEETIRKLMSQGLSCYEALKDVCGGFTVTVGKDLEIP
jgi:regulator of RNase E activity RraA